MSLRNDTKSIAILFLDNDNQHITDLSKHIKFLEVVKVDDSLPNPLRSGSLLKRSYTKYFVEKRNKYAILSERVGEEPYIPSNGINNSDIKTIDKWLKKSAKIATKIILFDWDRTISVVEGFLSTSKIADFLQDTMEYLLGGGKRVETLRSLFKKLHKNKVHVFVVTNNSAAENLRKLFLAMIKYIDPVFEDDNLICSASSNSKTVALLQSKSFTDLYGTDTFSSSSSQKFSPSSWLSRKKMMIAAASVATMVGTAAAMTRKKEKNM
jgi:hypothetical protein